LRAATALCYVHALRLESEYCYDILLFIHAIIDDYRVTKYPEFSVRLHLSQDVNCMAGM
jgi:hypothetical protein